MKWKNAIACSGLLTTALFSYTANPEPIDCPVTSAAGSVHSDGTVLVVGQVADGVVSNGTDQLIVGAVACWFAPACPGDLDGNGVIDLADWDDFVLCLTGPDGGSAGPQCTCFDAEGDGDGDLADFATFQAVFTGP